MSNKKRLIIFVLALVIFTLLKAPVTMLAQQAPLPPNLAYQGLSGTLWQGKIDRLQIQDWQVANLTWSFAPLAVFSAQAGFDIKFGKARDAQQLSGKGRVGFGLSGPVVDELTVRVPAAQVQGLLPIPVGELGGRFIANIKDYSKGETLCQTLSGNLMWTKASVAMGDTISFGTLDAELTCLNKNLMATFDGNNTLGLEGAATVQSPESFSFDGFVKPDASLPKMVHDSMAMFGKADSKGKYRIKL